MRAVAAARMPPLERSAVVATAKVVLFDFDGVLIHGDAFHLFIRQRLLRSSWRLAVTLLAAPVLFIVLAFSRRWKPWLLIRIALLGLSQKRYQQAAETFAADLVQRSRLFCRDGLRVLRQHQLDGDRVLVVSGCEQVLISAILRDLGLTELEVLASTLRPGWLGMRPLRHNIGRRKVLALRAHGVANWQRAYGDSMFDAAMLEQADEAVLVNGTPSLCMKMEKALGRAVMRVQWS